MPLIGQISLNTSLCIYLIWFTPQIFLNFKRKNTEGLSLLMHGILCMGYLSDLMYGFGRDMQWQYRMVTLVGLLSLSVQHYQFFRYGLHTAVQKFTYIILSGVYLFVFSYAVIVIYLNYHGKNFYNSIGMLANICWLSYMVPQIVKNYINQSTKGLSVLFVFLSIFLNFCDSTSAWILNWDYPSKIGPAISLLSNTILIIQIVYYAKAYKNIERLVINS